MKKLPFSVCSCFVAAALLCLGIPASAGVTGLPFRPVDAAYATPLDRVVFVSANPNQLHIYDAIGNSDQVVGLPGAPLNMSLAPDGKHAAVAFANSVAYVDLAAAAITNTYPGVAVGTGKVICGSDYLYVFPTYEGTTTSINLATGASVTSSQFSYVIGGIFDPAVSAIYSTQDGISPDSLQRFNVSSGSNPSQTSQPFAYFALFNVCGPLWLSSDGLTIYSGCGAVYRASTDSTQDMRYLGMLPFATRTQSLATSSSLNQIAAIPSVPSFSQPPATSADSVVNLYAADSFNPVGEFATTPFQVGGTAYASHGRWVFYNSSSSNLFIVTQADSSAGLETDFAIENVNLVRPNSCDATFASDSGSATAAGGYGTVQISSGEHCAFTAVSNVSWITLASGYYGSGNSTLQYLVRPNLSQTPRSGSIKLGSQTFTVSQDGAGSPTDLNPLSFKPLAAVYDKALDRIVMVSSAPNELHVYDPITYADQIVPLSYLPLSLYVRPDGLQAAVGHSGKISIIDLQGQKVTDVVSVDQDNAGIALASNGYAYAFPSQTSSWGEISSVQLSTGTVSQVTDLYHGNIPRLDSTGNYLYVSSYGGSSKLDISRGPASLVSEYPGTLSGNIWLSEDGNRLFSSTGNVFFISPVPSQDLQPDGTLTSSTGIDWISDSQANGEIAVLMDPSQPAQDAQLQIYKADGLQLQSETALPSFSNNGNTYVSHGKYLFWNSAESKLFAIIQADNKSGLLSDYAVLTVSRPDTLPACTYSVSPDSVNVWAQYATWNVTVASNCAWTPTASSGSFFNTSYGQTIGDGQFNISVWVNSGDQRSATIKVGNQTVTVNQAASTCTYSLASSSASFSQTGGAGTVNLVTGASCPWSVESNTSWLTVTGSASGTGPATIQFNVAPAATSPVSQSGGLNVAGIWFSVSQTTVASPGRLQLSPQQVTVSGSVGGTAFATVTITNTGGMPVTVDSVSTSGPFAVSDSYAASPFTVQAGASVQLTVGFTPSAVGQVNGVLLISSNAGASQSVALSGTGFAINAGGLRLGVGQSVNFGWSTLIMQSDGNLVLYDNGKASWASGTDGQDCSANQCFAVFQTDGNLVVYNGSTPLWDSETYGYSGAQLVLSNTTPELRIVGANQSILFANKPVYPAGSLLLRQGASVDFGSFMLVMQGDGNLVLYNNGTALWDSGTYGQDCSANQCFAVFQTDGNLVVYNGSTPLWDSETWGNLGAQLVFSENTPQMEIVASNQSVLWSSSLSFSAGNLWLPQGASVNFGSSMLIMQNDGNLVLYDNGKALWASGTDGQNCSANQCVAAFQVDGNFVVYNGSTALWNSGTYGHPEAQIQIGKQAPTLKISAPGQALLWSN